MTTKMMNKQYGEAMHGGKFVQMLTAFDVYGKSESAEIVVNGRLVPKIINEFWTARQRQANSLHEVAYRACFKGQLPKFFIERLTAPNDIVYDPFSGRGTTAIEAALCGRNVIANDINPLSAILAQPRLSPPDLSQLQQRLSEIPFPAGLQADIDLSMFYHPDTESEIVALREYLFNRRDSGKEDALDRWIRMVATNRLTGHSPGFFSVYTLPPNQAVTPESQVKINRKRHQSPPYRDVKALILRKSKALCKNITPDVRRQLQPIAAKALFLTRDARETPEIDDDAVQLTVTSPPFLDVVQYAADNWLRCWFNRIDVAEVEKRITVTKSLEEWEKVMSKVLQELFRITRPGGWVAFEVGEVRNGKLNLDEVIAPLGEKAGFHCWCVVVNQQQFTKTANIWGVRNNRKGTNTNRIVMFQKMK